MVARPIETMTTLPVVANGGKICVHGRRRSGMTRTASLLMMIVLFLTATGALIVAAAPEPDPVEPSAAAQAGNRAWDEPARARIASSGSELLNVDPCLPVTGVALSRAPTEAYTATEILFTAEIMTGSLPVTYTWSFGDATVPLTGTALSAAITATHTFTAVGVYTTSFTACNSCTVTPAEAVVTVTVAACQPISGTSISHRPASPRVGQEIVFTATVSDGLPAPAYEWAFGDGEVGAGPVVTHSYSSPLTYTVELTALNLCSHESVTETLTVMPRPKVYLPLILRGYEEPELVVAGIGYGASIAACNQVSYLADMGFDWAMGFVRWTDVGAGPPYNWASVDWQLQDFLPRVRHVLLRVHHPTPEGIGDPPVSTADLDAFRRMTQALAAHVAREWRGQGLETIAYEIWNEPNLSTEWGDPHQQVQPNAAQYTALLKAGYQGIKAGDAEAIVVSAGLATTGGSLYATAAERATVQEWAQWFYGAEAAVPDLTFLRNMYLNGAKGHFDALGSHPYGGPDAPETSPSAATGPIYFRRAEEQRQVMLSFGDHSAMWATELGWIVETSCDLKSFNWMKVSEAEQAQYLVGAYAYAQEHWPWMGPMVVFNLDFATVFYYHVCEQMRYYSLIYRQDPTGGPILARQAFGSLRDMPKDSAW
jgi:PKD repeat protein